MQRLCLTQFRRLEFPARGNEVPKTTNKTKQKRKTKEIKKKVIERALRINLETLISWFRVRKQNGAASDHKNGRHVPCLMTGKKPTTTATTKNR